jgi:hypothetical protein
MVAAGLEKIRKQEGGDYETQKESRQDGEQEQPSIPTLIWDERAVGDAERRNVSYGREYIAYLYGRKGIYCRGLRRINFS